MARRRDPSPFGSRRSDRPDLPPWFRRDVGHFASGADRVARGRPDPEFFRMLHALRATRIRLIIETVALAVGVAMFFALPLVALLVVVIAAVAGIVDLVILARLRRRVAEAWEDLAHDTA